MKTIIKIFLVFILTTTIAQSVDAQAHYRRNFYGDFFGGMTMATMDMDGINEFKKYKIGFMVGGNGNFKIFHNIELQTGFHLVKKGSLKHDKRTFRSVLEGNVMQTRDIKTTIDANYIQVPFNIGFESPLTEKLYLNMHAGVFVAYGFKGKKSQKGYYMNHNDMNIVSQDQASTDTFNPNSLKKWDYGIGANIGLVYDIYILRVQYDHGLANVANTVLAGEGNEWKTRNISICLGFRF